MLLDNDFIGSQISVVLKRGRIIGLLNVQVELRRLDTLILKNS